MSDRKAFDDAVERLNALPEQDPEVRLTLYGLYKQATVGDVQGRRPGMLDLRGQAKYDAWAAFQGWSCERAMAAYADRVGGLSPTVAPDA